MRFLLFVVLSLLIHFCNAQCVTNCNLNVGYFSNDNPSTIGYDNMGSSFHSTYAVEKTGFIVWGERMNNDGITHNLMPLSIDSINYPALSGKVYFVGVGSSSVSGVQMLVLTSQGLYASGQPGLVLSPSIKGTNSFSKVIVGGKTDGLPIGLTPDSIKMMFVTHRSVYLTSCGGNVYVLSQDSNVRGTRNLTIGSPLEWSKVLDSNGNPLSNIIATRGQGRFAFALRSDTTIWTWGDSVLLGNGTLSRNLNYAVQMIKPTGVPGIKMIQATTNSYTGSPRVSYYLLGTDKKVYSLGSNFSGQLGDRSLVGRYVWVNAKNPDNTIIDDAIWISANEHDNLYPAFGVLKSNGLVFTAGNNNNSMIGRAANPNFLDTPNAISKKDTILFFEVGGHTTAFIKMNTSRYGYVGHHLNGSIGNGAAANSTLTNVDFEIPPIIKVCGIACDTPIIESQSYSCMDTQAIFIVRGSEGNSIRYSIDNGHMLDTVIGSGDSVIIRVIHPTSDVTLKILQVFSDRCVLILNNVAKKLTTYSIVDTQVSICTGQSFRLGNKWLVTTGIYRDTLTNMQDCDSFITVHLTVNSVDFNSLDTVICEGSSILFKGQLRTNPGVYYDTFANSNNCDSIIQLHLSVKLKDTTTISDYFCEGSLYKFNQVDLNTAGTYRDTFSDKYGCDSFVILNLTRLKKDTLMFIDTICKGEQFLINSKSYNSTGFFKVDEFKNLKGCDSIILLHLTVDTSITIPFYYFGCDSVIFRSRLYTASSIVYDTFKSKKGCDSVIHAHSIVINKPIVRPVIPVVFCDSLLFHGKMYYSSTYFIDTLKSIETQCDSIIQTYSLEALYRIPMQLSIIPQKDSYRRGEVVMFQAVPAQNYLWNTGETTQSISTILTKDSLYYSIGWNNPLCKDTAYLFIKTIDNATIKVPTGFTPNGDGNNDILYCRGFGIKKLYHFKIYNRWGQLLYSTSDITQGWDGTYNGDPQNSDTYFYNYEAETYPPIRRISGEGSFMLLK